jgi:hypothetical protein
VNAASLRRTVTELLQPTFETGKPPAESTDELFDRHPDLRAFADARERVVADLVAEVATESKVPLSFILMGSRWDIGASANSLNGSVARFEILAYTSSSREVARRTKATLREVKDGERLVVGLQTYPPAAPDAATLKENVQAAWQAGARCLSFYHYGIMPPANLAWVAEALASVRS